MARTVQEVLKAYTPVWMRVPGVVGTAQGEADGQPCILVLVVRKTDRIAQAIPESVEGHRVQLEETGRIRARSAPGKTP